MRNGGFIKIRRGLREHLCSMSGNAVKLYLWLHLSANYSGPKKGCAEASYRDIADCLGWNKRTLDRAIAELKAKYIEVQRAGNQHQLTAIKILRYDHTVSNSAHDKSVVSQKSAYDSADDKSVVKPVVSSHSKRQTPNDLRLPKKAVEVIEGVEAPKMPAADDLPNPWKALKSDLPMGSPRFQKIFEHYATTRRGNPLSEAMERTIQMANKVGVKVPPPFFEAKREVERRELKDPATPAAGEIPVLEAEPWAN